MVHHGVGSVRSKRQTLEDDRGFQHLSRSRDSGYQGVAIFPFKRSFQTGLVDEDLQSGYSTVEYTPGSASIDQECWYMGVVTEALLDPNRMAIMDR
jgi:hypothetical protein